jgi:hypothetical protein
MTANELLDFVGRVSADLLSVETWRIVLLLLGVWGVLVLVQIRRLLKRLVEEIESRPFFPGREERVLRDDISIT